MSLNIFEAVFLGLIQGVTEWLPISSSGHLAFFSEVFGLKDNIPFSVLLHGGTLLVVLIFFRKQIWAILRQKDYHTMLNIIIATIPIVIVGPFIKKYVDSAFSSMVILGFLLVINGYIINLNKKIKTTHTKITRKEAFKIGLFQILAIFPGISRSGMTITTANMQGIEPSHSAAFAFLISIPAVFGAMVLESKELMHLDPTLTTNYAIGFLSAVVSGYLTLFFLMWIIKKAKLHNFAYYSWTFGLIILLYSLFNK